MKVSRGDVVLVDYPFSGFSSRVTGFDCKDSRMKRIEYKTFIFDVGILNRLTGNDFGNEFLQLLSSHGDEGWDLKEVIRQSGLSAVLVFSREAA